MKRNLVIVSALVLAIAACSTDSTSGAGDTGQVEITDFEFTPETLTVAVGSIVTWENIQPASIHTSNSDDELWQSGTLNEGDEFSFTFDEAGTFTYFCTVHPDIMKGTVVVEG